MDLSIAIATAAVNGHPLRPEISKSSKYKHYLSKDDSRRCEECEDNHGKIYLIHTAGRIWYEADLNYIHGKRNGQRIVFSNDGLIFVTYDHYKTFYEIT